MSIYCCNYKFVDFNQYDEHLKNKHFYKGKSRDLKYSCVITSECEFKTDSMQLLRRHFREDHQNEIYYDGKNYSIINRNPFVVPVGINPIMVSSYYYFFK